MPGNILTSLRQDAVQDAHAQLPSLPFSLALSRRTLPSKALVRYLRAMAGIQGVLAGSRLFSSRNRAAATLR
jgi:hypothetical protein